MLALALSTIAKKSSIQGIHWGVEVDENNDDAVPTVPGPLVWKGKIAIPRTMILERLEDPSGILIATKRGITLPDGEWIDVDHAADRDMRGEIEIAFEAEAQFWFLPNITAKLIGVRGELLEAARARFPEAMKDFRHILLKAEMNIGDLKLTLIEDQSRSGFNAVIGGEGENGLFQASEQQVCVVRDASYYAAEGQERGVNDGAKTIFIATNNPEIMRDLTQGAIEVRELYPFEETHRRLSMIGNIPEGATLFEFSGINWEVGYVTKALFDSRYGK